MDPNALERIEKTLNQLDEKVDLLVRQHEGVFKDVEWLKGSLRIGATFVITSVLGILAFFGKHFFHNNP